MINKKNNNKLNIIYILIFFMILSMVSTIRNTGFLKIVSIVSCLVSIFFVVVMAYLKKIKTKKLLRSFLIYLIYNVVLLILGFTFNSIYLVFQELALLLMALCLINLDISDNDNIKIYNVLSVLYYLLLLVMFLLHIFGKNDFLSVTIYKSIFALSYFAFIKSKNKFLFSIFSFSLFFLMGERTSAIIIIIIYIIYKFIIEKLKSNKSYKYFFIIIFIILFSFVQMYVKLPSMSIGIEINELSRKVTGENFFSGRNVIWTQVLHAVENDKLFGLTYDNNVNLYYGGNLSTHNLYLWLLLNGGYVLLILFILFLYNIWNLYYKFIEKKYIKAAAAYLIGIIILCNFELLLIVNNFSVSLFLWLTITLPLGLKRE